MSQGCPSVWRDLTDSHRQIREQLEGAINDYINGRCREGGGCYAPIIVAPYGSGKTTLLRHLLCFSIRSGIPAVLINLSRLVDYLKNKVGDKIDEDNLPGYVAMFCRDVINDIIKGNRKEENGEYFERCCINDQELVNVLNKYVESKDAKCVLLIDEIEEAYNHFRELISYGTTPFRGLFDSIKEGKSRVLAIMTFGPSSIYSEAVSLSGTWRTRTFIIPLITPLNVPVEGVKDELRPYIANLVWWIGKGRAGHVWEKVVKSVNIRSISTDTKLKEIAESIESGSRDPIETLMSSIDQVFGSFKGVKVTEGTPYIDFEVYREFLTKVNRGGKDLLKLFALLTLLIGPVPQSILERYLSKESIRNMIRLRMDEYIVKSNKVIEVSKVIDKIKEWLGSDDPFTTDLLSNVILAWSNHKILLLDRDAINDLLEIIKALSIEMYKPEIYDLINRIDIKNLYNELEKLAESKDEYYFALRPSVIEQLYPPIILTPLVGCSKDKKIVDIKDRLSKVNVEEVLGFSEELLREVYGNQNFNFVFAVVPSTLMDTMKEPLLSKLIKSGTNKLLLLPIPVKENENLDKAVKDLEDHWKNYIDCGIAGVINPGEKLSLFIMGKLYNRVDNCQREPDRIELNLSSQYVNALRRLIDEKMRNIVECKLLNEEVISSVQPTIDYLIGQSIRAAGSTKAEYVWLLSSSPHAEIIKNYLIKAVEIIDDVKMHYAKAFKVFDEDRLRDTLLKEIKSIVNDVRGRLKEDRGYINNSINLWNEVDEKVRNTPAFEILRDLVLIKLKELKDAAQIRYLVEKVYPSLRNIVDVGEKPLGYMLVWSVLNSLSEEELNRANVLDQLLNKLNENINENKDRVVENILKQLKDKLMDLHELHESIYDVIKTTNDENLRERAKESDLMRLIDNYERELSELGNSIRELDNKYYDEIYNNEIKAQTSDLTIFEKILILEFIYNEILGEFLKNLSNAIKNTTGELSELGDVIRCVNEIRNKIINILQDNQYDLDDNIRNEAVKAILEDFLQILGSNGSINFKDFKDTCNNDLKKNIENLEKVLSNNAEILKNLKKVYERIFDLQKKIKKVINYE